MFRLTNNSLCANLLRGPAAALLLTMAMTIPSLTRAETQTTIETQTAIEKGTLAQYIPGDVWLYSRAWRTPSRDVMTKHWARIIEAVKNCGLEEEFRKAIASTIPADKKTEFQKKWTEIVGGIFAIEWTDLFCDEFAFAERFNSVMPDIMVLFRPKPETLEQNVKGLANLFDLFNTYASGAPIPPTKNGNLKIWTLESAGGAVGLHLLHIDDKIAIVFGQAAFHDVQSLLLGEGRVGNILNSAKFQRAIKDVPKPGHSITYMDMDRLFKWFTKLPDMILGERDHAKPVETGRRIVAAITKHLDFLDYIVMSQETNGHNQVQHTVLRIKSDCCQKPFAKAFSDQKLIENFARYVPVESKAYFVSTMVNPRIIHDIVLDVVRNDIPGGPELCKQFENVQREMQFDVCQDLLDWIGGEIVFSTFPPATPSPFGKEDGVFMLRVRDADLARTKFPQLMNHATEFLKSRGQQLTVSEAANVPVPGFKTLTIPTLAMFIGTPCYGIWEDWAIFGGSQEAVALVINTANGKHPSISNNERVVREAYLTDAPVVGASFADLSNIGQEMSAAFFSMGFIAGMLPNEPEMAPTKSILNSLVRLGPVMNQIDFLSSSSSLTTFKDNAWHSKTVTTYKSAESKQAN